MIYILLALLVLMGGEWKKWEAKQIPLALVYFLWFLLPFLIGYFYSIKVDAVLQNSVLIFSSPFLLMAFLQFLPMKFTVWNQVFIAIFSLVLISQLFYFNPLKPNRHFADFQSAAADLARWQEKYPRVIHFAQINHPYYLKYYQKDLYNIHRQQQFGTHDKIKAFNTILGEISAEYLSFTHLKRGASPLIFDMLKAPLW